ncbi:MAG: DUF5107 domain-containing protein [Acidobacteria bacterium]|nr:DUF5107 domain-containing protein [Acidobacteriota bacterium]
MRIRTLFILVFCLLCGFLPAQAKPAEIREYKKVFATYPYSDPNPVPAFGRIYPYYRFEMYTDKPENKEWTVVELENDYIKVMILPEIGGKIWTAIEKSTGKPFIYNNQVVKFRDISMRGPWTSGGIEANYGIIGHTPNCATPVDYLTRTNDDGSVSCFIGVLDLLTRTPWRLEINLPADKAFFTTSSFWYNASSVEQPYYTWMNTGIKAAGNLEFIYPGTSYLGHGGEHAEWPVNKDNGKRINFYEQNNFGGYKSYHVFGKYTEFFGGYWHDEDFGMARYSSHDDKAGKKIWIWGLSQQGMIWEKLLSDTDGQYVEVQSGRLFNQSAEQSTFTPFKHRGFAPYSTDQWTEYWFPVKATKGFVKANPYGALNVKNENGELKLFFSPVQFINDRLEVFDGEKLIYSKQLLLKPLELFTDSIKAGIKSENLHIRLGGNKFEYNGNPTADDLARPLDTPDDFAWDSLYGLYLQGKEDIRQRNYTAAKIKLEGCLKKDRNFLPALTDLAMIEYRNMNFTVALEHSKKALSIDTYDPAANYYYALANLEAGRIVDAKDGFDIAAMSAEFRSAAYTELSRIYFREKNFVRAGDYSLKALDFNRFDLDAMQIQAIIHRLNGNKQKAVEVLKQILSIDPLNHFAGFEQSLWEKTGSSRRAFVSMIRNEMPHETFLELAIWYYKLGLSDEAESVLGLSPKTAETEYWLAFLKNRRKDAGFLAVLKEAYAVSPNLTFPFRSETAEVLKWAIENDQTWQPKYYLALIHLSRNDDLQAWKLLNECGNKPDYAPFYAARSELAAKLNKNNESLADLNRAREIDPGQWRYGRSLVTYYTNTVKQYPKAVEVARSYFSKEPRNYQIGLLLAKSLLLDGQYRECAGHLSKLNVLPYEGASEGVQMYREAHLMLALAAIKSGDYPDAFAHIADSRLWPENLGAGKPYQEEIDERPADWLLSIAAEKLKKTEESKSALNRIVAFNKQGASINTLISAMALKKLGRQAEAQKLMNDWVVRDKSRLAQWAMRLFQGRPADDLMADDSNFRVIRECIKLGL